MDTVYEVKVTATVVVTLTGRMAQIHSTHQVAEMARRQVLGEQIEGAQVRAIVACERPRVIA